MTKAPAKILALVMLLVFASPVQSQSSIKIRGLVVDANSGEPLPGANIQVAGTAFGAAADLSGRFEIENLLNGIYTLHISFIGYATQSRTVVVQNGEPELLTVRLRPTVIPLPGVEITNKREEDEAVGVVVLTRQDIRRFKSANVAEALEQVGGVQVIDAGGRKTISIRGARANQTLVLLDGVKLNDELTGEADLSQVPVNAVERIEVVKGSAAEYGGGAIAGVVKITTDPLTTNNVLVGGSLGAFGFRQLESSVGVHRGNVAAHLSLQSNDSHGDFPYTYATAAEQPVSDRRRNSDIRTGSIFARVGFRAGRHSASFKLQRFASDRGAPGKVYSWTPYARTKMNRRLATFDYAASTKAWQFHFGLNYAIHRTENMNLRPEFEERPFGPTPQFHFENQLTTLGLRFEVRHQTKSWLQTFIGGDGGGLVYNDRNVLVPRPSAVGEAQDRSFGIFYKQKYEWKRNHIRVVATPILRFDQAALNSAQHKRFERQWSPGARLFLSWGGEQRIYLKGEAGRGFRMPTFADLFYQDFRVQGKPDLAPEKSRNTEFGVGVRFSFWLRIALDAAFYRNKIDDMIVWRIGSFEFFRPYNTDAELSGAEYSLHLETPSTRTSLDLFFTRMKALNKNENLTLYNRLLPYRPEHSFKANLNINGDHWRSSIGWRAVGRRFVTEANTKSMPPYAVLDCSIKWTTTIRKVEVEWQFIVFNLLNETYQIIRDMPLPGREWRLGLSLGY